MTYIPPQDAHYLAWWEKELHALATRTAKKAWEEGDGVVGHVARKLHQMTREDPELHTAFLLLGIARSVRQARKEDAHCRSKYDGKATAEHAETEPA